MVDASYKPYGLEPIETASRDEITALQTQRLAWSLKHAYDNVEAYKKKFDAAGVHPVRFQAAGRHREISVHHQGGPARQLSVRHVRGAAGQDRAHPRLVRHHRQADRGRLYAEGHRQLGGSDGALDPRLRRAAGHEGACRLWLWPVHRRAWRALRRREARLRGDPDFRRHDRAAGAAHFRFQARHHHGDAELHAGDPRRIPRAQSRSARLLAVDRHFRRRALDQPDARRDRGRVRDGRGRHLRAVGSDGSRRRQ